MDVVVRPLVEREVAELAALEPPGHGALTVGVEPELRNLQVVTTARGRGIGTALVRAAEAAAREAGAASLSVGVADDNPRARALYERLGYVGTGIRSTTTYAYVDDQGVRRTATEVDEILRRPLAS